MNIKALLQKRADLIAEQKKLFETVGEGDWTPEQRRRDDEIVAELETVGGDIGRAQRQQDWARTVEGKPVDPPAVQGGATSVDTLKAEILDNDRRMRAPRGQVAAAVATRVSGGDERAAEKPFATLGHNMLAAVDFAKSHELPTAYRQYAANVQRILAASGLNENVGSEGGVLVQTDFVGQLLAPMTNLEQSPFVSRARNIPVSSNANGIVLNAINETSRATGSRWGGVRGYRLAEASTLTASKPDFRRMELRLKKYGVLEYATDELLGDAAALESVTSQAAGEELAFMCNDDLLNGLGVSGALGALNAAALVSVAKETGQSAATILNANVVKMWQRLHPRFRANSAWFINSECEPQLDQLAIAAGTGALEPRYVTYRPDGVMAIKGRPVIVTEFNAALGTVGDIVLADWSNYLTIDKGGVQQATSIHVQFLTDEQVFRFIYRFDGQPALNSPITPYKGSNTQSAYVALATRS